MSSGSSDTKSSRVSRANDLIDGTKKHFPNASDPLEFGGAKYTVAQVLAMLQSIVDLRDAVDASKATTKAKLADEHSQSPPLVAVMSGYTSFVRSRFGNSPEALNDFGLAPPKPRAPKTTEEKAVAAAKRDATRKARHTMGPKQKKDIPGNVSAELVVTPMSNEPAKPAPAPQATATTVSPSGNGASHS